MQGRQDTESVVGDGWSVGGTGMNGVVVCDGNKASDTAVGQPSSGDMTGES